MIISSEVECIKKEAIIDYLKTPVSIPDDNMNKLT
jgi:hypothetical protein